MKKSMNNLANTKEDVDRQSGRRLIGIAVFLKFIFVVCIV